MRVIHCRNLRFISFECLFRYMIRNKLKSVNYIEEVDGTKEKEQNITYDEIKEKLVKDKYNVNEIIRVESSK